MQLSRRVKVTICDNQYNMKQLIQSAIAAKAAPVVHAVIADEVIRLGIGRREYRAVVVSLLIQTNKGRDREGRFNSCTILSKVATDEKIRTN